MKLFYFKIITFIKIFTIFLLMPNNDFKTIKFQIRTFKFLENYNINDILDEEKYFFYDLILNNIYTSISLGTPPQKIIGFYSGKENEFDIIKEKCYLNYSKYDRIKSKTFNNLTSFNIIHKNFKNGCFAKENFQFELYEEYNKNIIFNQLKFFLPDDSKLNLNKKESNNTCAIIGLRLNNKDLFTESPKNFVYYLMEYFAEKNNKLINNSLEINNYYWTIKYNDKNENLGYFSIGDPPHLSEPEKYKEKKFFEFNIEFKYSSLYWEIQFNEIYLNKTDINNNNDYNLIYLNKYFGGHNCVFYPEINLIFGTIEYFNVIKNEFFNKFFSKGICYIKKFHLNNNNSTIIEGFGGDYNFIICNKYKIKEYGINQFYLEFPSLNFYFKLMNYTFTFNSTELFLENKDAIYFLICNKKNSVDQWVFGKIFMKKYQIVFNSEMKTMAFYINNNIIYNEIKSYYNKKNIIIIILINLIILIILCIIINKYRKRISINKEIFVKELEMINKNAKLI